MNALALGARVNTPHGPGKITGYRPATVWGMKGPRNRQMLVIEYDSPRRTRPGLWFPDAVTLTEGKDS